MSLFERCLAGPVPGHVLLAACVLLPAACGGGPDRYQGMTADDLFRLAEAELAEGEHENAIEALDRLLLAFGSWERVPEARIRLAEAYYANEEYITARSEYERFLDRYPAHPRAPDAALGICRSLSALSPEPQRDQTYTQEAITRCRNAVVDYGGTEQAAEAARISNELRHVLAEKDYLNADFYFRRELYDSAIKYYEFVVRLYPETPFAPMALLGIYRSNQAIGYADLAEEARQQLLSRYPDSEAAAEIRTNGAAGA